MDENQNLEPNTPPASQKVGLREQFTTVTPVSKFLAMILFVVLPFVGFWLGTLVPTAPLSLSYKDINTPVVESESTIKENAVSNEFIDSTKLCRPENVSTSTYSDWEGTWLKENSDYFTGQDLQVCKNADNSLNFHVGDYGSHHAGDISGYLVISGDTAQGKVFDPESSSDRKTYLDCAVKLVKSTSSIELKATDTSDEYGCLTYAGAGIDFNGTFRNDIIIEEPTVQKNWEVDDQVFNGSDTGYVFKTDDELNTFIDLIGDYSSLFAKRFASVYRVNDKNNLGVRIYQGGTWYDAYGMVLIGEDEKMWVSIFDYQGKVRYFTNVTTDSKTLPQPISDWLDIVNSNYAITPVEVIFMNKD